MTPEPHVPPRKRRSPPKLTETQLRLVKAFGQLFRDPANEHKRRVFLDEFNYYVASANTAEVKLRETGRKQPGNREEPGAIDKVTAIIERLRKEKEARSSGDPRGRTD